MRDVYENNIVCKKCRKVTIKSHIIKEGFKIRTWECKKCGRMWHHPLDSNEYLKFSKLRQKEFKVKLRKVGNSYSATIPQEIVEFEGIQKEGIILRMQLEAADTIAIKLGTT